MTGTRALSNGTIAMDNKIPINGTIYNKFKLEPLIPWFSVAEAVKQTDNKINFINKNLINDIYLSIIIIKLLLNNLILFISKFLFNDYIFINILYFYIYYFFNVNWSTF